MTGSSAVTLVGAKAHRLLLMICQCHCSGGGEKAVFPSGQDSNEASTASFSMVHLFIVYSFSYKLQASSEYG